MYATNTIQQPDVESLTGAVIADTWTVGDSIFSGYRFGLMYGGQDRKGNQVVIKASSPKFIDEMINEEMIYKRLDKHEVSGICKRLFFGRHGNFMVQVRPRLGISIGRELDAIPGPVDVSEGLKIGIKILNLVEELHNIGVIVGEISSEDVAHGLGPYKDTVFLFNFESGKLYDPEKEIFLQRFTNNGCLPVENAILGKDNWLFQSDLIYLYFLIHDITDAEIYSSDFEDLQTYIFEIAPGEKPSYSYIKGVLMKLLFEHRGEK